MAAIVMDVMALVAIVTVAIMLAARASDDEPTDDV